MATTKKKTTAKTAKKTVEKKPSKAGNEKSITKEKNKTAAKTGKATKAKIRKTNKSAAKNEIPQDDIRVRAYYLWEESGRQPDQELDHWLKAEEQLEE